MGSLGLDLRQALPLFPILSPGVRPVGQHEDRCGVAHHGGEPFRGLSGVEGQIGGPGLEDAEHADDEIGRTPGMQADHAVGAGTAGCQRMGETAGATVEGRVVQFRVVGHHRALLGSFAHLRREALQHARRCRAGHGGPCAEGGEECPLLVLVEQRQVGDLGIGLLGHQAQHAEEVA